MPQGYYFIENIPAGTVSVRATLRRLPAAAEVTASASCPARRIDRTSRSRPSPVAAAGHRRPHRTQERAGAARRGHHQADRHRRHGAEAAGRSHRAGAGVAAGRGAGEHLRHATCRATPLISVRGGRVDQNATYIDGVPVQNGIHTGTATCGRRHRQRRRAPRSLTVGDQRLRGRLDHHRRLVGRVRQRAGAASSTSRPAPAATSSAATSATRPACSASPTTARASTSSPARSSGPIGKHLTFFVSGRVEGQQLDQRRQPRLALPELFRGRRRHHLPGRAQFGKAGRLPAVDSIDVPVYNYAVTEGGCDLPAARAASRAPTFAPMAANYGATCHANQAYAPPSTNYFTTDKLNYSFGQGSRLSLSYLFSGNQNSRATTRRRRHAAARSPAPTWRR